MMSPEATEELPLSRTSMELAVDFYADFYCVSASEMRHIIGAESRWNQYAHNYNPKTGDDSWGLVQINKYKGEHSDISIADAESPFFALNFLAENLKAGNCSMWTTCDESG